MSSRVLCARRYSRSLAWALTLGLLLTPVACTLSDDLTRLVQAPTQKPLDIRQLPPLSS